MTPPARAARLAYQQRTGESFAKLADRVDRTPAYILRCERSGFNYFLAVRLSRLYGAPIDLFLTPAPGNSEGAAASAVPAGTSTTGRGPGAERRAALGGYVEGERARRVVEALEGLAQVETI